MKINITYFNYYYSYSDLGYAGRLRGLKWRKKRKGSGILLFIIKILYNKI